MRNADIKVVEWSKEDQSYVGYCPGVIGPCCHGDDEVEVFRSLCEIVDEWLETYRRDNRPLPPPTVGRDVGAYLHDANDSVRRFAKPNREPLEMSIVPER